MQVDAVHVNVNQERQGSGSGSRPDKGKGGGKGKERDEKVASKFEGECRYCHKKGHKKAECRKMKADLAACNCDNILVKNQREQRRVHKGQGECR